MKSVSALSLYEKHYADSQFERAGLFKKIRKLYGCTYVLYPGSYVHITPSFFFPHVVYVDRSPVVARFFADAEGVLNCVRKNQTYERPPFIRFIARDFSKALPLQSERFDLLIALHTGGIARACSRYVRSGGLLLTNNRQREAWDSASDNGFTLVCILEYRKNDYLPIRENLADWPARIQKSTAHRNSMRRTTVGFLYKENDEYFVFEKKQY